MKWPVAKDVGRYGDMSSKAFLRVGLDNENDVYMSIVGHDGDMADIEFCIVGLGGGKSERTRAALIALMVAMEEDNKEDPSRDWWANRMTKPKT